MIEGPSKVFLSCTGRASVLTGPLSTTQHSSVNLTDRRLGGGHVGWMNKLFWGDNLQVMSHLLREYRGKVDLIYIDPPFDSKADYKKKINLRGKSTASDSSSFEEKQYSDIWTNDEYLQFMYERLILCRELMSDTATIYVHCDHRVASVLKCVMDEIFGVGNFLNQITWRRQIPRGMKAHAKHYPFSADYILMFGKSGKSTWNRQVAENLLTIEEAEKRYKKDERGYFRTSDPGSYSYESLVALNSEGRLYPGKGHSVVINERERSVLSTSGRKPSVKYYREIRGSQVVEERVVDNIWDDIPGMGVVSSEFIGYPTQKPARLLERIIRASSDPGDLVFDCFMGSGTTQAVAMKLGRRFIGADINLGAIQTTTKRLIGVASELEGRARQRGSAGDLEGGQRYTGFDVYNVNNYDFFRNPVEARSLLMQALEVQPFHQADVFDGELDGRMVKVMPVNHIATKADLSELLANLPYKTYEKLRDENPGKVVERITLICMGHEPDLKAHLEKELDDYKVDVEIVDILRDRSDLQLKREAEAEVVREGGKLVIRQFYPLNLMQKLSLQKDVVTDWRELVDSIMIDFNFDGVILEPSVTDVPEKTELVAGIYDIPEGAGTIKVKITDLLSESLEVEV